jgi:ABC-type transport system involved in cytochrome c biogenesis permease subunit
MEKSMGKIKETIMKKINGTNTMGIFCGIAGLDTLTLACARTYEDIHSPLSTLDLLLATGAVICLIAVFYIMDKSIEQNKIKEKNHDLPKLQ